VGHADSPELLHAAFRATYTPDGKSDGSAFSRAFSIEMPVLDSVDLITDAAGLSLADLLLGVSCEEQIAPRFARLGIELDSEVNCAALVYECEYRGSARAWLDVGLRLRFCGAVEYDVP
jgi:hypothetical protein